jgi:hypothetical protein
MPDLEAYERLRGREAKRGKTPVPQPRPQRWQYSRDGDKFYLAEVTDKDGPPGYIWNGKHFFSLLRGTSSEGKASAWVQVFDSVDPGFRDNYRPEHWIGAEILQSDATLPEALGLPGARLVGRVRGGTSDSCWQLAVEPVAARKGFDIKVVVDLDASHDYLPRRIELTESVPPGGKAKYGGWRMEWQIEEFSQVQDNALDTMRWFPKKGRLVQEEGLISRTFLVEDLSINATLPESTFDREIPEGSHVMDSTREGTGRVFLTGDAQAMDRRISELVRAAQGEQLVDPWWRVRMLGVAGSAGIFIAVLLVAAVRRRRRQAKPVV